MSCKSKCKKSKCGCNSYNNCCPPNGGGATGPQGLPGVTGIQGPPGVTGIQGPPGVTGIEGPPGVTGLQGPPGVTGLQGPPGVTGIQGPPGVTGLAGGSAVIPFGATAITVDPAGLLDQDLGFAPTGTPLFAGLIPTALAWVAPRNGTLTDLAVRGFGPLFTIDLPVGQTIDVAVYVNGAITPLEVNLGGPNFPPAPAAFDSAVVPLVAGDVVEVRVGQTGLGLPVTLNIAGGLNFV